MTTSPDLKPLIAESSTSEATTVEVMMNDLRDKTTQIPDYQRDSDQWEEPTRSLLIESVINNLSIPAFFLEVNVVDGVEKNEVIDGQQRLTTLFEFYQHKLRLVDSQDAPYLSPNSVHYANRTYDELPEIYKQAFKKYRVTVIKLRNLGDMRLEVFRRINQGGTPLSGQDIRLAYYGAHCPSLAFMRVVGIYDPDRQASKRFVESAKDTYNLTYPWTSEPAREVWRDWWEHKDIARGQTASESFLWAMVAACYDRLDAILQNPSALQKLNTRYNRTIDEALDAYCAQLRWQDTHPETPPLLLPYAEMKDKFFPYYQNWIATVLGQKGVNLQVTKHRLVSALAGAAYRKNIDFSKWNDAKWTALVEFIRRPQEIAKKLGCEWPQSKGRWDGLRGYKVQFAESEKLIGKIAG